MVFNILNNGEIINTIVADEQFCREYCAKCGYTYQPVLEKTEVSSLGEEVDKIEQIRADIDYIAALMGVDL